MRFTLGNTPETVRKEEALKADADTEKKEEAAVVPIVAKEKPDDGASRENDPLTQPDIRTTEYGEETKGPHGQTILRLALGGSHPVIDGKAVPTNLSLHSVERGRLANTANTFSTSFAKETTDGQTLSLTSKGDSIGIWVEGLAKSEAIAESSKANGSAVRYRSVRDGVDLEYRLTPKGIKENFIIGKRLGEYRFHSNMDIGRLTPEHDGDSGCLLLKSGGDVRFRILPPVMSDAEGATSNKCSYEIEGKEEGRLSVVLTADRDWIDDPGRKFPVTIDPSIEVPDDGVILGLLQYRDGHPFSILSEGYVFGARTESGVLHEYELRMAIDAGKVNQRVTKTNKISKFEVKIPFKKVEINTPGENPPMKFSSIRVESEEEGFSSKLSLSKEDNFLSIDLTDWIARQEGMKFIRISYEKTSILLPGTGSDKKVIEDIIGKIPPIIPPVNPPITNPGIGKNPSSKSTFAQASEMPKIQTGTIKGDRMVYAKASTSNMVLGSDIDFGETPKDDNGTNPNLPFQYYAVSYALSDKDAPSAEIVYQSDIVKDGQGPRKEIPFANGRGKSVLNLFSGNLTHVVPGLTVSSNSLSVPIDSIFDLRLLNQSNGDDFEKRMGKGWKTSLHQYIVKVNKADGFFDSRDVAYVDGNGDTHVFVERWFYKDPSGKRQDVDRNEIYLDHDRKVKWMDKDGAEHELEHEARNDEGLTFVSGMNLTYFDIRPYEKKHCRAVLGDGATIEFDPLDDEWRLQFCYFDDNGNKVYVSPKEVYSNGDGTYRCAGMRVAFIDPTMNSRDGWSTDHFAYYSGSQRFTDGEISIYSRLEPKQGVLDLYRNDDIAEVESQLSQAEKNMESLDENINSVMNGMKATLRQIRNGIDAGTKVYSISSNSANIKKRQDKLFEKQRNFQASAAGSEVFNDSLANMAKDKDFTFDSNGYDAFPSPRSNCHYDFDDYDALIAMYNTAVARDSLILQIDTKEAQDKINALNDALSRDNAQKALESLTCQYLQQMSQRVALERAYDRAVWERNNLRERKDALAKEQRGKVNDFIIDTDGNTLGFDGYGRLILIQDRNENKIEVEYEQADKSDVDQDPKKARILSVHSETDKVLFNYDGSGLLESMTDRSGRRVRYSYDGGQIASITYPDGRVVSFTDSGLTLMDELDNSASFMRGQGGIIGIQTFHSDSVLSHDTKVAFERKTIANLTKDSDVSITYVGNTTTVTDNINQKGNLRLSFDARGNLIMSENAESTTLSFFEEDRLLSSGTYDNKEKNVLKASASGSTGLDINALAEANGITLPNSFMLGLVAEFNDGASPATMRDTLKDPKGNAIRETSMSFDTVPGRKYLLPIRMKRGEGLLDLSVSGGSVKDSKLVLLSEGSIRKYRKEEDGVHDLISEEDNDSITTYDGHNSHKPLSKTEVDYGNPGRDVITRTSFNSHGQAAYVEDSDGNVEEHAYDAKGNETEVRAYNRKDAALAQVTRKSYDDKGNVTEDTGTARKTERRDENGALVTTIDREVNRALVSYSYDHDNGNLLGIVNNADGLANSTSFGYRNGLLTRMSSHGVSFTYDYDGKGRRKACHLNERLLDSFEYVDDYSDERLGMTHGSLVKATTHGDGTVRDAVTEQCLDDEGRERLTRYVSGGTTQTIESTYDPIEKDRKTDVVSTLRIGGKTTTEKIHSNYVKDMLDHVEKSIDGVSVLKKSYTYDSYGQISKMTSEIGTLAKDKSTHVEEYSYDDSGNISNVRLEGGKLILSIERDALQRTTGTALDVQGGKSIDDSYEYLIRDGNSTNLVGQHVQRIGDSIDSRRYAYDGLGNITRITAEESETRYSYDGLNRLVREDNPVFGKSYVYKYDSGGNILLKKTYAYSTNRILFSPTYSEYGYDHRGYRDQLVSFEGKAIQYDALGRPTNYLGSTMVWNERGLLEQIDPDGDGSGTAVTYGYDAGGIRVSKTFSPTRHTEYVVDGRRVLGMRMTNGNSTRAVLFTYANDSLVGFTLDGTHYLYTRNIQGDITAIVHADGSIVCRYYYDAYGNQKVIKTDNNSDIADINPFRYRGYFYDTETGLYYLNSRYYDPRTGRFISRDDTSVLDQTKAELNGLNLYTYCGDNPVMNVDPSGKFFIGFLIASIIIGAVIKGTMATIKAKQEGKTNLEAFGAFLGGAVLGAAFGAVMAIGGAAGAISVGLPVVGYTLTFWAAMGISAGISFGAGILSYSLQMIGSKEKFSLKKMLFNGFQSLIQGLATFSISFIGGRIGVFDKSLLSKGINPHFYFNRMINHSHELTAAQALVNSYQVHYGGWFVKSILSTIPNAIFRLIIDLSISDDE